MIVKVVAYVTNQAYKELAEALCASARQFGIENCFPHRVGGLERWRDAVAYKPHFILARLEMCEREGLLYTDADSVFRRAPDWSIFNDCDVSFHKFKRGAGWDEEFLTGTMFFRRSGLVAEFVRDWADATTTESSTPEQTSLKLVWPKWEKRLRFKDLPPEYVWIFDTMPAMYPNKKPVIEHFQASRTLNKDSEKGKI